MHRPSPQNREVTFDASELFFSRTDKRGTIISGNDVFSRIANYPMESLRGTAHNVIRHPDMPKAVFRVFWQTIEADKPISAYVKNMASDGSYYWVFATAFPVADGYLSIRVKPLTDVFKLVGPIYQKVLEKEKKDGIDAGIILLLEILKSHGFADYDTFMRFALVSEINARSKLQVSRKKPSQVSGSGSLQSRLFDIACRCNESARENTSIFAKLEHFLDVNHAVNEKSAFIIKSLQRIDLLSVNMSTAAKRIGSRGVTLAAVANGIQRVAGEFKNDLTRFNETASLVQATIRGSEFVISNSKLQIDMIDFYANEVLKKVGATAESGAGADSIREMRENSKVLLALSGISIKRLTEEMFSLRQQLLALTADVEQLRATINGLEIIRKTGNIEAAQTRETSEFQSHFQQMSHLVHETRGQLDSFGDAIYRSFRDIEHIVPSLSAISRLISELDGLTAAL